MPEVKGIPVAPGLAFGRVHIVRSRPDSVPLWTVPGEAVQGEIDRLGAALDAVRDQLGRQQEIVRRTTGEQDAAIFAVHRAILEDPTAVAQVERRLREERVNAEWAVQALIDSLHKQMSGLDGDSVRRYAEDVSEPWVLVRDQLLDRDAEQVSAGQGKVVLAAAELTPQVVTFLERERVLAILTEAGGRFSHGAVLARSFGIPCVVGLPNLLARLEQDMQVLVDGDVGLVTLRPGVETVDEFLERQQQRRARKLALDAVSGEPAVTPDGHAMAIQVNLESIRDLGTFPVQTCDGVGLLRTEFLYMERSQFPSEEDQYRLYRRVVDHMEGRPVVVRVLDIGGDKQLPYFQMPAENNPALGWRGIRVTLEWQDLLRVQLRAALRASAHGEVRLLVPMVGSLEQVRRVREVLESVRSQLVEQGYEVADRVLLGIMIEVPSAVVVLPDLLELVDFVSVGTNDLVQYLLAVDRDNAFVSGLYDPHHPAVVRVLQQIATACAAAGVPCSVCGELAGDPAAALSLLGMGYASVSAAPNFLPELRFVVRNTTLAEAQQLAQDLQRARTSREVHMRLAAERRRLHRAVGVEGV
ncbi:MAG: phosphoenolpyruvate--protein phosphotransferase [Planctomycetes bacterium]|nr:phosphoenolpyruvate--protein phosphotransferase [Planctomycetota bacterium]MDA0947957.1 phosphoenolpyruvate--protein phosphotransferase [Planctomycetota bacterium]